MWRYWLPTYSTLWSCDDSVTGAVHTKRYLRLSAGHPMVASGQISTFCVSFVRRSYRVMIPPMEPEPDPLDHTRLPSTVSGVAHPLSPPPTVSAWPRTIVGMSRPKSPARELLGTMADGPSWRLPYTLYGMRLSTVA